MSVVDDPKTYGRARLSFASEAEIDEFITTLERYERGELTPDQWRQFRLVRGTYGQRQAEDAQMLRVKIPQGALTSDQLEALADVADRYSRGFGHITTRQNLQFHFIELHDIEPAMRRLAEAGVTPREACGNSVRNITACPYAGVAADERFDVTPYAEDLTRYLLRHPLSSTLPRKFKIGFEGCPADHIGTPINDLGFRAVLGRDGGRAFHVTAGGGTAILCASGGLLHEFLPASEILRVAEAVLRVFHRLGDYQHKQRNRMKFLIKVIGWTRWREEYDRELSRCRLRGEVPTLEIEPPALEPRLDGVRDASPQPGDIASRVAAGRLAVTQSRGLGQLLEERLRERPDLVAAADGARIKISGCPNGCGQHHVATIGFQGSVRRLGSRAVPQYFVMVGGGTTARGATFGRLAAKIPVRRIPAALERLIDLYDRDRHDGESAP